MAQTSADSFLAQLAALEQEFTSSQPVLELVVRDRALDVEGFVIVWNTAPGLLGPLGHCGKGGTRITPNVTLDEIRMLASRMALKNAAAGLAFGGAKSGLRADPDSADFEKKYRRFVQLAKPILITNGGVFGGFGFDLGAKPIHAIWACEEMGTDKCFTGKALECGGTDYDREGIAGLGVATAAATALELQGTSASDKTFAVQGIGAMGAAVVRYFSELGGQLVAISDPIIGGTHYLHQPVTPQIIEALGKRDLDTLRPLLAQASTQHSASTEDVLYADVDVLFPAARQDVIHAANVGQVRARLISEGANNPTSTEAYEEFYRRGVLVLPDFIANPGGVIAAFVEMTTDVSPEENAREHTKVRKAKEFTKSKIRENVTQLLELVSKHKVAPYRAGRYMALKFIAESERQSR